MNVLKKIIAGLLVLAALLAVAAVAAIVAFGASPSASSEKVSFSIAKGETMESVANRLEKQGIIRSALFLRVFAKARGSEQSFQQGNYAFARNLSAVQIHDLIVSGKQVNLRVTIPEGFTLSQIARHLESLQICKAADFMAAAGDPVLLKDCRIPGKTAEGYLFPDTYYFPQDFPAETAVRFMVNQFWENLKGVKGYAPSMSPEQVRDKLIVASIVEREYINPTEAPLMASVFYNRLSIRKPLESCATVVYVMTEEYKLAHPHKLFYRDLDRQSPYNTYLHAGLPPGPISNPGLTAIQAAFQPAKSDYMYFVLKGPQATQHFFSRTFAEHNSASIFYLKG